MSDYKSWTPIWSTIVDSSIWAEPPHVRLTWVTMLAIKNSDHCVRMSEFALARRANLSEVEVIDALNILSSPDTKRVKKQPYDGRRIEAVDGGWKILNGEKYRELVQAEMKRARIARAQKAWRERKKRSTPTMAERIAERDGNQ